MDETKPFPKQVPRSISPSAEIQNFIITNNHQLGKYKLGPLLGQGGMGVIYQAQDLETKRVVAVKILLDKNSNTVQKLLDEASCMAQLEHANIVRFYEINYEPRPFFVMEYVEGIALSKLLQNREALKEKNIIDILILLCQALSYAHKKNILHRDIKPQNIIITEELVPKITDFGLARSRSTGNLTTHGIFQGTPNYVAPEQIAGKTSVKSEVYSLGATMYEMLTSRPPFQGDSNYNVLFQVANHRPIRPREIDPTISPYLEAICLKCLEKESKKRYRNCKEFFTDLQNLENGRPITAKKYTSWDAFRNFFVRNRVFCISVTIVLFLFTAFFSIILFQNRQLNKKNYDYKVKSIMLLAQMGKTEKAIEELQSTFSKKSIQINDISARVYYLGGDYNKALLYINRAMKQNLNSYEFYIRRGKIFEKMKDYVQAIENFERAGSIQNNVSEYLILKGQAYTKLKQFPQAVREYTSAIEKFSPNYFFHMLRGHAYFSQKNFLKALQDFNTAIKLNPQDYESSETRADIYLLQGNYQEALSDYNKVVANNKASARTYIQRGALFRRLRNYERAIADYNMAQKLNPVIVDVYNNRSNVYLDKEDLPSAMRDAQICILLKPNNAKYRIQLSRILNRAKRYQLALDNIERLEMRIKNIPEIHEVKGMILYNLQNYKQALASFRTAQKLGSQSKDISRFISLTLQKIAAKK
ncbi:protein kinase [Candidatus Uabimicrobium sp. HlEnr_7]|uniref:protein kinase domain-containing protein n=1 Tax=Candidatus Uabimicrobium helgolandensis TaxID=3095367 RepID=UPI003556FF1F